MNWPEAFFLTERLEDFEDAMLHGEENAVLGGLFAECLALAKAQATALIAAEARIAELEAALMPFAEQAERYDPDEGDDLQSAWDSGGITIGDLRRARAVLNPGDQK